MAANKTIGNIPLGEKMNLSIAEASVYTGIGQVTLRKWWTIVNNLDTKRRKEKRLK